MTSRGLLPEQQFFAPENFSRDARILDVGCGDRKKVPWAVGIDRVKTPVTDVVHDLDHFPWPFQDGSFDVILASHVVEHLGDLVALCREFHRIAKDGATIRIATPHLSNPDAYVDPTHRRAFGYRTFEYFAAPEHAPQPPAQRALNRLFGSDPTAPNWYCPPLFEILERRITFRKPHRLLGLAGVARTVPLIYEYFLSGFAPARDMLVLLRVRKP